MPVGEVCGVCRARWARLGARAVAVRAAVCGRTKSIGGSPLEAPQVRALTYPTAMASSRVLSGAAAGARSLLPAPSARTIACSSVFSAPRRFLASRLDRTDSVRGARSVGRHIFVRVCRGVCARGRRAHREERHNYALCVPCGARLGPGWPRLTCCPVEAAPPHPHAAALFNNPCPRARSSRSATSARVTLTSWRCWPLWATSKRWTTCPSPRFRRASALRTRTRSTCQSPSARRTHWLN